jgi:alpha-N-arabinofuranosidase
MMLNQNVGTVVLPTRLTTTGGTKFAESVSQDSQTGAIYIKGVNAANQAQKVNIVLDGVSRVAPQATVTVLTSASPQDTNTLTEPTKVVPVTSKAKVSRNFDFSFAPYSVTVLAIQTK